MEREEPEGAGSRRGGRKGVRTLAEVAGELNLAARQKWALPPEKPLPALILVTDETRLSDPTGAMASLPAGSAVLYRHYGLFDRAGFGRKLRESARQNGLLFTVAGDLGLAEALDADGCHMPEDLAFRLEDHEPFRTRDGRPAFNTLAAHSEEALERAARLGVDAALLSPVFATRSHPEREPLGAREANRLAQNAALPVYALGGLTLETALALKSAQEPGAFAGIAAIGALTRP